MQQNFKKFIVLLVIPFLVSSIFLIPTYVFAQEDSPLLATQSKLNVIDVVAGGKGIIDWSDGIVKITGAGFPPDNALPNQKRLWAENNAIVNAYKLLAEVINEIKVDSESIVKDYINTSETIKTRINAFIRGAQRVDRRILQDGSIEVDMILKLYGPSGLSDIIQPQKKRTPPPPTNIKPIEITKGFTGVIIDCRHLKDIEACLSPSILDKEGGELYIDNLPIDNDFVIKAGVVSYTTSIIDARKMERVGNNSLELKALRNSGSFKVDVILDDKDTPMLLGANKETKILETSKIIFVLPQKE